LGSADIAHWVTSLYQKYPIVSGLLDETPWGFELSQRLNGNFSVVPRITNEMRNFSILALECSNYTKDILSEHKMDALALSCWALYQNTRWSTSQYPDGRIRFSLSDVLGSL
jgi:hypothetical protein